MLNLELIKSIIISVTKVRLFFDTKEVLIKNYNNSAQKIVFREQYFVRI